ncbi:NAD-dependent epimerase/dehydratase family protein [Solimicrobium silvestre]|uniref:Nucleoside-diphosphate-sugar epimerase n=1 Tax=Solimicrobium silvestre TaxID=2099400 RepID=A0A2S9GVV6_9BURK|nr:NAD-dependent epimerase/dehydratase family protein [Solimicrobium silvestre]PRC91840.1 Nucleoside-diphosphate-sugar epimerase [Solimicrobium silvestre]
MATVLVTGAGGYLASWIVNCLLQDGHVVHGTVRKIQDTQKVAHLLQLADGYPDRLKLFDADLLIAGSFDVAMEGCSIVIHAASPYFIGTPKDPMAELVNPAVKGTRNVLDAVNRTGCVQRVVLTSSIAAMYGNVVDLKDADATMLQEGDINHSSSIASNPYAYSKTLAEKAAWEIHGQQSRWSLVTINPGAIFGPSLSKRKDATSVTMIIQFLNGSFRSGVPNLRLGVVDVRDAAIAHVKAATLASASGRYIAVAESLTLLEIARKIAGSNPAFISKLPAKEVPKALIWLIAPLIGMTREYVAKNVSYPINFNNRRSREELSVIYRPSLTTLNDHVKQLVDDGLLED